MKKTILFLSVFTIFSCAKENDLSLIPDNSVPLEIVKNLEVNLSSVTEQSSGDFGMLTFNIGDSKRLVYSRYYFDANAKMSDTIINNIKGLENPVFVTGYFPSNDKNQFTVIYAGKKAKSYSKSFDSASVEFRDYTVRLIEDKTSPQRKIKDAGLKPDEQFILEKIPKSITYDWLGERFTPSSKRGIQ